MKKAVKEFFKFRNVVATKESKKSAKICLRTLTANLARYIELLDRKSHGEDLEHILITADLEIKDNMETIIEVLNKYRNQ